MTKDSIKENDTEVVSEEFPELKEDVQEALRDIKNFGENDNKELSAQDKESSELPPLTNTESNNAKTE